MSSKTKSKYYVAIGKILKEERNKAAERVSIRKGIVSVFLVRSPVTYF